MKKIIVLLSVLIFLLTLYFLWAQKDPIRIVYGSDDNYLPHMATSIASIVKNADKNDKFDFYLLESSVSEENKAKLKSFANRLKVPLNIIHVDNMGLQNAKIARKELTVASYLRFFIPDVLPFDKVLYLDGDTLVFKSLRKLFDTNISDVYAGVVAPRGKFFCMKKLKNIKKCFNAGVMLLNLKKMRQDNITSETLFKNMDKLHKTGRLTLEDEGVLNFTFNNNVKFLPSIYNYTKDDGENLSKITILHLFSKPWKKEYIKNHIYWKYRAITPWGVDPYVVFSKMCPIPKHHRKLN